METVVISVGGSLIVPNVIDVNFLRDFKRLVLSQMDDKRFIIVTGGGKTARDYQKAAGKVREVANEDLDWLGIHATRINAHLMRTIFREHSHAKVIHDPKEEIDFTERVLIASGSKPGWSTDYVAVLLAKQFSADTVLNMSNIDYVYDKDPSKFSQAKPFPELSWNDYMDLIPEEWDPGLSSPFDPVASREARDSGMEVIIMSGNVENLEDYLNGREFKGTVIG